MSNVRQETMDSGVVVLGLLALLFPVAPTVVLVLKSWKRGGRWRLAAVAASALFLGGLAIAASPTEWPNTATERLGIFLVVWAYALCISCAIAVAAWVVQRWFSRRVRRSTR
jgi:hypothetical protein